jgi:hypothetical protein
MDKVYHYHKLLKNCTWSLRIMNHFFKRHWRFNLRFSTFLKSKITLFSTFNYTKCRLESDAIVRAGKLKRV